MGTVNNNGGTLISFPNSSLHAVNGRMPSHHHNGCANFTFQIPSIANNAKRNTNSAERRANHNAVERARRECLNIKFQELAQALPSLSQIRRPSKSIIVQKSLEFIHNVRQKDDSYKKEIQSIRAENESLREEVNRLRKQLGMEPLPPPPPPSSSPLIREDSKSSNNSNNTSLSSPSTSSTSSPHLQQLTDETKEDVDISNITTAIATNIKLEADNHITTPSPTTATNTTTIIPNNIINNNINAINNNHNNNINANSANIIIENTTTYCNGNCNGNCNSNCCNSNTEFINIKNEEFCSDDDCSNKHAEDDYDNMMDMPEKLDGKNLLPDQTINGHLYNDLIYPTLLSSSIDQHTGYSTNFEFTTMDMTQMVDTNSIQLHQFGHNEITNITDDLNVYCNPYSLNHEKIYPSPPRETTIINLNNNHNISGFQMMQDNPHI